MQDAADKKKKMKRNIAIGCGTLVTVLFVCTVALAIIGNVVGPGQSNTTTATTSTPTSLPTRAATKAITAIIPTATPTPVPPTPTPTPKPTPTRAPNQIGVTHGYPHVGGPLSDFVGKYGAPVIYTTFNDGDNIIVGTRQDAHNIVNWVGVTGPDSWTTTKTRNYCLQFVPSDAVKYNEDDQIPTDIIIDFQSSVGMIVASISPSTCMVYIGDQ